MPPSSPEWIQADAQVNLRPLRELYKRGIGHNMDQAESAITVYGPYTGLTNIVVLPPSRPPPALPLVSGGSTLN